MAIKKDELVIQVRKTQDALKLFIVSAEELIVYAENITDYLNHEQAENCENGQGTGRSEKENNHMLND